MKSKTTKFFYPKLAAQNIKNNGKFYFPYILTIIGTVAVFYIFNALAYTNNLPEMTRYSYLSAFMQIGISVVVVFSIIFLFYTNSFLIKRRKKELGLYNVLGMDKKNLALMLGFEHLYVAVAGIGLGLLGGMLFQKLITMFVAKLMNYNEVYGFYISTKGIMSTLILFGIILFITYIHDLRCLHLQKPVEMLSGGNVGEREPKTKWLLTIFGILTLGSGYGIAIFTKDPVQALVIYFLAVILVIIGTYCLFTAGSITLLKLLRKNKRYYYKTSHFISISGMIYRMKRNAVGLANISILSCMVLVIMSATLSLFAGTENSLNRRCPSDFKIEVAYLPDVEEFKRDIIKDKMLSYVESQGMKVTDAVDFRFLGVAAVPSKEIGKYVMTNNHSGYIASEAGVFCFIPLEDYIAMTGDVRTLEDGEILVSTKKFEDKLDFEFHDNKTDEVIAQIECKIKGSIPSDFLISEYAAYISDVHYIIVPDYEMMLEIWNNQKKSYDYVASQMRWNFDFNVLENNDDANIKLENELKEPSTFGFNSETDGGFEAYYATSRAAESHDIYSMNNGFLFLGIFLGLLFIMATVLIIYYKQVSEGYEDRERFQIMQKVGLPKNEIKHSINRQMLTIFFLPLLVAAIHVAFDFPILTLLLRLFQLENILLSLICTGITFAIFLIIYIVIYLLTAKIYYKIVE